MAEPLCMDAVCPRLNSSLTNQSVSASHAAQHIPFLRRIYARRRLTSSKHHSPAPGLLGSSFKLRAAQATVPYATDVLSCMPAGK